MTVYGGSFDTEMQVNYVPQGGYARVLNTPSLNLWINSSAGTLQQMPATGANVVGYGAISSTLVGLVWNATADANDQAILPLTIPADFFADTGRPGGKARLLVRVKARKRDTTGSATDNADLALTLNAHWHNSAFSADGLTESDGDTSVSTLAAVISNTLNASSGATDGAEEKFRWYDFDVTAAMTDAQRQALRPGASMKLTLAPQEAVGTALAIDVLGVQVLYRGTATIPAPKVRNRLIG